MSITTTVNTYSYNGATYDGTVYMITPYSGDYYEQTSVAVPTGTAYVGTSSNSYNYFATPSSAGNMANPWVSIPVGTENGVTTSIQTTTSGNYTVYHYAITAKYGATIEDYWPDVTWMGVRSPTGCWAVSGSSPF